MQYDELTDEQKVIWDTAYDVGHNEGYDAGWEAYGENNFDWDEGHTDGFNEGIKAEQDRIQSVLQMMFEAALNMGQGNKAVQYRQMMDLLTPVEINHNLADDDF